VDQFMETAAGITIFDKDTVKIGESDLNGYFQIELTEELDTLFFAGVGYEWLMVAVPKECESLEVILFLASSYDFMSTGKVDKSEKKSLKNYPNCTLKHFKKDYLKPKELVSFENLNRIGLNN